ncbi:putative phage abortive infection protein [Fodinibius halophilus]|uniref:Phage abortive infection protein n=1 Tax=Fodinibius halophilus TaxID=1736908 RepID=A0A6M1TE40_9BACT|nr:putative phage abortive infection protein [Fodinibius halophilus]NGP90291.1 hypothetical protein [Fodinibius halophilus]
MSKSQDYFDEYLSKAKFWLKLSLVFVLIFFVSAVIIFLWGERLSFQLASDTSKYSQFGDFSGGILASIFSFLTFILLLFTYYQQKADSESNQELTNKSLSLIRKQNFEDTFFQMVKNLNEIIRNTRGSIKISPQVVSNIKPKGNEYFEKLLVSFKNWYRITSDRYEAPHPKVDLIKDSEVEGDEEKEKILEAYNDFYNNFYERHNDQLGHIFRYIHNILKFSEESLEDTDIDSSQYVNILQSQLSDSVLALLFYNSISEKSMNADGEFEFRERLDNYEFFQNLREANLVEEYYLNLFETTNFRMY